MESVVSRIRREHLQDKLHGMTITTTDNHSVFSKIPQSTPICPMYEAVCSIDQGGARYKTSTPECGGVELARV